MLNFNANKKCSSLLSALLLCGISLSATAEVTDTIEKNFEFNQQGKISLSNINGDVSITACDCSEVSFKAIIKASDQENRDKISVEIDQTNNKLKVETRYKKSQSRSWNNNYSKVDYILSVPNAVNFRKISLVNGDLTISGVSGSLNASLVNGELESDGLTANTRVDMVNGDMTVKFVNLDNAKNIFLKSVNGDISVYLPDDANADLNAETVSGQISNDFGIEVIKGKYVGRTMRGEIGSGDVSIDMDNVNGRIRVNKL